MNSTLTIIHLIDALLQVSMIVMVGVYFIFSNTIMKSLQSQVNGAEIMVEINKQILNPLFIAFFLFSALAGGYFLVWGSGIIRLSGGLFLIGTTFVTVIKNVPLNNQLRDAYSQDEQSAMWRVYLREWVFWNHVRTVSAVSASFLLVL